MLGRKIQGVRREEAMACFCVNGNGTSCDEEFFSSGFAVKLSRDWSTELGL